MERKYNPFLSFFEDLGLFAASLGLFSGGIILLWLKIPFWSLFLGIAAVQIGIVLCILAFDVLLKRKTGPITEDYKTLPCLVCSRPAFVPKYARVTICETCQIKIANSFKGALFVIFTLVTLASAVYLVGQNQNIAEKAFFIWPSPKLP